MKKVLKVGLVGCGTVANNHLRGICEYGDSVVVTALCDILPERAEECKQSFAPNAKIFTDYVKMLDTSELDAVHIATPHYLHAEMTIAALKRGINVFLEKPMCINADEIEQLIAAEKESTARVCVCFQNRFTSAVKQAKAIADEDGGVISANASLFWKRDEKYYTGSGWRGKFATEGGGVLINQAVHTLDLLYFFAGKPKSLFATVSNHHLKGVIEVEDTAEAMIKFQGGAVANFYATTASLIGDTTTLVLYTKNHRLELRLPHLYVDGVEVKFDNELAPAGKQCYGNGHYHIISMFYDALFCEEKEMPVTLSDAQYAVRMLLAAYKSGDMETII
ncbi:MAG: Gfo/Idh/MocA family oxidoreductase [Clostridia bacterium]|nr:Gfo/Idh/MocA family oxidoreductase [Clostridia bacterium]